MNEILTKMTRVEEDKEPFVKALPQYPYRGTMAANEGLGVDPLEDIHHTQTSTTTGMGVPLTGERVVEGTTLGVDACILQTWDGM